MIFDDQAIPSRQTNQEETEAHQEGSLREYRGDDRGYNMIGIDC